MMEDPLELVALVDNFELIFDLGAEIYREGDELSSASEGVRTPGQYVAHWRRQDGRCDDTLLGPAFSETFYRAWLVRLWDVGLQYDHCDPIQLVPNFWVNPYALPSQRYLRGYYIYINSSDAWHLGTQSFAFVFGFSCSAFSPTQARMPINPCEAALFITHATTNKFPRMF
jgi:hypothetical protein